MKQKIKVIGELIVLHDKTTNSEVYLDSVGFDTMEVSEGEVLVKQSFGESHYVKEDAEDIAYAINFARNQFPPSITFISADTDDQLGY